MTDLTNYGWKKLESFSSRKNFEFTFGKKKWKKVFVTIANSKMISKILHSHQKVG